MVWPWIERFEFLQEKRGLKYNENDERLVSLLNGYIERMKQLPAVKETLISTEKHAAFFEKYMSGSDEVDYDIGL
jgi:hypothetical protein